MQPSEIEKLRQYRCPVCGIADENAYTRCHRPDCTDGRDPRPQRPTLSPSPEQGEPKPVADAVGGEAKVEPVAFLVERLDGTKSRYGSRVIDGKKYDPRRDDFWIDAEAKARHRVTPLYLALPSDEAARLRERVTELERSCAHWMNEARRTLKAGQDALDRADAAHLIAAALARVEQETREACAEAARSADVYVSTGKLDDAFEGVRRAKIRISAAILAEGEKR